MTKGEDIKPCFFHLKDLPALLTLLKESGHPCTQELSSFIMGYMFARLEDQVKEQKAVVKGEQLPAVDVKKLWDGLLEPTDLKVAGDQHQKASDYFGD